MLKNKLKIRRLKPVELFCLSIFIFTVFIGFALFAQDEFKYDSRGKHNPFFPLVTPDGRLIKFDARQNSSELSLEGIVFDLQGSSYALVNGQVAREGDVIGDYRVIKIEEKKVTFDKGGQNIEMELKKEEE